MNVGQQMIAEDFVIAAPPGRDQVSVALIRPFYFEPDFMQDTLSVIDGRVEADATREISKGRRRRSL